MRMKLSLCMILFFVCKIACSEPPQPPVGYRWVIVGNLSDEFNGDILDSQKWYDYNPWWEGRPPAKFVSEAITLKDGFLQIQNGILDKTDRNYTLSGGAVLSKSDQASYGYYECRFKASKTTMSTTFWLTSHKKDMIPETECATDKFTLELDIVEVIGDSKTWSTFKTHMGSNTHWHYWDCNGKRETYSAGASEKLSSEVAEEYHTYAAWWRNAKSVTFYADDKKGKSVTFRTDVKDDPFSHPMMINMVTETYDWELRPSDESLLDSTRNTSYYDWVRTYDLAPVDEYVEEADHPDIYSEDVSVSDLGLFPLDTVAYEYEYKANEKRALYFKFTKPNGDLVFADTVTAYKGYGRAVFGKKLDFSMELNEAYKLSVEMRPFAGTEEDTIRTNSIEIIKETFSE